MKTIYRNEKRTITAEISSGQNRQKKKHPKNSEELWRIEIEKECNFNTITAEELLISKYMTAITDKKLQDKLKEKTLELKKKIELMKQNKHL